MGNSDSKNPGIMLQHQNIQDWTKVQDQGNCELWINNKTCRHFKAYPIPSSVSTDPQELERYTFRKTHHSHIVSVEGVLGQGEGFLCTEPRSSFVLVQNITSRISDNSGEFTFQQALYVLYASATGYNTLNSFFGPLEPHEDMICINEEGRVKVWLNQNLASNTLSRSAKSNENENNLRGVQGSNYALAKRRIRQSVLKLFWIVERTLYQGYPTKFKEESQNVSTFFEVVNFVEHFSQHYGIRIPESIPRAVRTHKIPLNFQRQTVAQQVVNVQPYTLPIFPQRITNLETSRINNIVYRSSIVRDATSSPLTISSHPVDRSMIAIDKAKNEGFERRSILTQSTIVPRVNFQIRPSMIFHQQAVGSFGQPQLYNLPPPKLYATSTYTQQVVVPPTPVQQTVQSIITPYQEPQAQIPTETNLEGDKSQNREEQVDEEEISHNNEPEVRQENYMNQQQVQSFEQPQPDADHESVTEPNQPAIEQRPPQLQQDKSLGQKDNQQEPIIYQQRKMEQSAEEHNINGTQFTFSKPVKHESLKFTQQGLHLEYPEYPEQQQEEQEYVPQYTPALMEGSADFIPQYPGALLQGSLQFSEPKGQYYQDAYEVVQPSPSQQDYTTAEKFVPSDKYRPNRSPIFQQDENCPPTPQNEKGSQIQQWQAELNRYTNSPIHSKKAPKEDNHREQYTKTNPPYKSRDTKPTIKAYQIKYQKKTNEIAELEYEDIEKYIRMKYQHYLNEPEAPSKEVKPYKYEAKKQEPSKYQYKQTSQQSDIPSWKKTQDYSRYEAGAYQSLYDKPLQKEGKYNIDKQNHHPNKYSTSQDYNYDQPYKFDYNSAFPDTGKTSTQYISQLGDYYPQNGPQSPQLEDQYLPRKQQEKTKKRNTDMTKIDQKYNKYVLNAKKAPKPAPSGRGMSSWEVSMIYPGNESKVTKQELNPIFQSFQPTEGRLKTSEFGQGSEKSDSGRKNKKVITYDKLRTLLWQQ